MMPDAVVNLTTTGANFATYSSTITGATSWAVMLDMPDDPEGLAGVREPRNPLPVAPSESRVR